MIYSTDYRKHCNDRINDDVLRIAVVAEVKAVAATSPFIFLFCENETGNAAKCCLRCAIKCVVNGAAYQIYNFYLPQ